MKSKLMLVAFCIYFAVSGITAQNRQRLTNEERAKSHTEMLNKQLELNEDQREKINEINLRYGSEYNTMPRTERNMTMEERANWEKRKAEYESKMQDRNNEIKRVLNPDQVRKYEEMQNQQTEKRNNKKRNR